MKLAIEESVLRQALESLTRLQARYRATEKLYDQGTDDAVTVKSHNAIAALRNALDAAEKVEPVAWVELTTGGFITTDASLANGLTPLYTLEELSK